jgi:microcystin degradation protein MlrC
LLTGHEIDVRNRGTGSVIGGFYDAHDVNLVPIFSAGAWPSGPAEAPVIAELFGRLEDGLRRAGPLDAVVANLHGAMVAEGLPDVEAAALSLIREVVGDVPVGAVLDLHANPSPQLVDACDVLVSYDTYPHVDMRERGAEVIALTGEVLRGRRLMTTVRKVPLLVCPLAQATDAAPMRTLQAAAEARAKAAGIARVCVVGGFAYSDVERAGMSVLVIHDDDGADVARDVVDETIADICAHAEDFAVVRDSTKVAVASAVASVHHPVFLADVADNVGGGSPGDGTALLAELLAVGAKDAVVTIADREAALLAAHAGVGAVIDVRVGGKTDRLHGAPVPVRATVVRITDGRYRAAGSWMTGREFSMGTTAVLAVDGVTLVVTERATPPFHAEQLSSVGVDVARAKIVVVKGAIAWRAAYGSIAAEVIEVATPGVCPVDIDSLPRRTVPMSL